MASHHIVSKNFQLRKESMEKKDYINPSKDIFASLR